MGACISRPSTSNPIDGIASSSPDLPPLPAAAASSAAAPIRSGPLDGLGRRQRLSPDEAATAIQARWHGARQRVINAEVAQGLTPYRSEMHYKMATHSYSGEVQRLDREGGPRENNGWPAYSLTKAAPRGSLALLHSFQRGDDLAEVKESLYPNDVPEGVIYNPDGNHDMRVNSAWMLGLAHHGMPAVMTGALDDTTVVRSSARESLPEDEQTTDSNLSALAREVLGMTESGHYRVGDSLLGKQVLVPTASAAKATLKDFKTPFGIPQDELKRRLDHAGIDTSELS